MLAKNEGVSDRLIRTMLGGGLLAVSATSIGTAAGRPVGILAAAAGAILLFTAATRSRFLYRPLGIDTSTDRHGSSE